MPDSGSPMRAVVCFVLLIAAPMLLGGCGDPGDSVSSAGSGEKHGGDWHTMTVTASAYTLAADETDGGPTGLAAWGDVLKPGMNAIAVSHDLIKIGLTHMARVKIEGLPGVYVVRDKMNKRWTQKIDILMTSKQKASEWGERKVTIHWKPPPDKS